jgi:hypothetical protein
MESGGVSCPKRYFSFNETSPALRRYKNYPAPPVTMGRGMIAYTGVGGAAKGINK